MKYLNSVWEIKTISFIMEESVIRVYHERQGLEGQADFIGHILKPLDKFCHVDKSFSIRPMS